MDTKECLRQKIYKVIRDEGHISFEEFSPDIIINEGAYEFWDLTADFLIIHSADAIGLPIEYFGKYFPYKKYFDDNGNPLLIPLLPFFFAFLILKFIYRQIQNLILYFLKRPIITKPIYTKESKQPITALEFADIMIDFLEKYKAGYKLSN